MAPQWRVPVDDLLEHAIHRVAAADHATRQELTAILQTHLGWFYIRSGRLDEAKAVLQAAHAVLQARRGEHKDHSGDEEIKDIIDPLIDLGLLASIQGNYAEAMHLAGSALHEQESRSALANRARALYVLAGAALAEGEIELAHDYARNVVAVSRQTSDRWFLAYCLVELGSTARALGNVDEAEAHYQASYAIREEIEDPERMAVALNHQGELALHRHDPAAAESRFRQTLSIYREIDDRGGLATSYHGLGRTAAALGDVEAATAHFYQALDIAHQAQYVALIFPILLGIAQLDLRTGHREAAKVLLFFVAQHPASSQSTSVHAQHTLRELDSTAHSMQEITPVWSDLVPLEVVIAELLRTRTASHPI